MATLRIDNSETYITEVTVRESDEYTESAYITFDRNIIPEGIRGVNKMFMTPTELDLLGRFFIRQAEEIRQAQFQRRTANRNKVTQD